MIGLAETDPGGVPGEDPVPGFASPAPEGPADPYGVEGGGGSDGAPARPRVRPVFLQDFVDVPRPLWEVRRYFCRGGDWLAPLAHQAHDDANMLLLRIGAAAGLGRGLEVRVRLGDCVARGEVCAVPIRWEAAHLPQLFPVLDGDVELAPLGPDQCRLVLRGSYRPPFERLGRVLDSVLLHRIAESTIRSFLVRVADSLATGRAAAPVPEPEA